MLRSGRCLRGKGVDSDASSSILKDIAISKLLYLQAVVGNVWVWKGVTGGESRPT